MSEEKRVSFSYDALDEDTRVFVQAKADVIHGHLKRTAEGVIAIGTALGQAQARLPHGTFLSWIQTEFAMGQATAYAFLRVANRFEDKLTKFVSFPVSVLYELASPSVSDTLVEQVRTGVVPPTIEAIREAKVKEQQARTAEQEAKTRLSMIEQALLASQQAHQQAQQQVRSLTDQVTAFEQEAQEQPQEIIKEIEVVPEAVQREVETLKKQVADVTTQRDNLAKARKELADEARTRWIESMQERADASKRVSWRGAASRFRAAVREVLVHWPGGLDRLHLEAEDWHWMADVLEDCRKLLREGSMVYESRDSGVVEAGEVPPEPEAHHD